MGYAALGVYGRGLCRLFHLCSLYAIAYKERAKEDSVRAKEHSVRAKEHCFKIDK